MPFYADKNDKYCQPLEAGDLFIAHLPTMPPLAALSAVSAHVPHTVITSGPTPRTGRRLVSGGAGTSRPTRSNPTSDRQEHDDR